MIKPAELLQTVSFQEFSPNTGNVAILVLLQLRVEHIWSETIVVVFELGHGLDQMWPVNGNTGQGLVFLARSHMYEVDTSKPGW